MTFVVLYSIMPKKILLNMKTLEFKEWYGPECIHLDCVKKLGMALLTLEPLKNIEEII